MYILIVYNMNKVQRLSTNYVSGNNVVSRVLTKLMGYIRMECLYVKGSG